MSIKSLVDVTQLSKKRCKYPIETQLKYATVKNFVGRIVEGYHADAQDICLLAHQAAEKLCEVQNYLIGNFGCGLLVFDAYRPLRAVKDFARWFTQTPTPYELVRKEKHYPHLEKSQLADLGYVAGDVSRHCFAGTVDLTLIELPSGVMRDMGARFDYFDEISHATATEAEIGTEAYKNRQILISAMQCFGYLSYPKEYWHFDFETREISEPLDIEITTALRGINS